jgi:hypothetical protein
MPRVYQLEITVCDFKFAGEVDRMGCVFYVGVMALKISRVSEGGHV